MLNVCSPPSNVRVTGCSALFHPSDAPDLPWGTPSWDACGPPVTLYSFDKSDSERFVAGKGEGHRWMHFTDGEWHADRGAVFEMDGALVLSSPAYPPPGGRHRIEDRLQLAVLLTEDFEDPHGGALRLDARVERSPFCPNAMGDTGSGGSEAAEALHPSGPGHLSSSPPCPSHAIAAPPRDVTDMAPLQDMRLAFSEVGLIDVVQGLYVGHAVSDDAHYALYEIMWSDFCEEREATAREGKDADVDDSELFAIAKFLCKRERPSSDVALTLDSSRSEAVWYIDGREVHRRGNLGLIPPLGPGETLLYRKEGRKRPHAVCPGSIHVVLSNSRILDAVPVGADVGAGVSVSASDLGARGGAGGSGEKGGGGGDDRALVRLPGDAAYTSVSDDPSRPPEFRWNIDNVPPGDIATQAACFSLAAMTVRFVPARWPDVHKYVMLRTMSTTGWREGVNGAFVPFASPGALRGHVALSERAKEKMGLANGDTVGVSWFKFLAAGIDEPPRRAGGGI